MSVGRSRQQRSLCPANTKAMRSPKTEVDLPGGFSLLLESDNLIPAGLIRYWKLSSFTCLSAISLSVQMGLAYRC